MQLPFTSAQFIEVFRRYNEGVWPAQFLLFAAGIVAVTLAFRVGPGAQRGFSVILALLWVWMGAVYHIGFFSAINPAARIFGIIFIAQGALIGWLGIWKRQLTFDVSGSGRLVSGSALLVYALVVYPMLGFVVGHRFPDAPTFGLPCPTTIFTIGLLLWARPPASRALLVIPMLWTLVGTLAALELGVYEDFGLLAALILAAPAFLPRRTRAVIPA